MWVSEGGSLVYANTLPVPPKEFFEAASWSKLASWEKELAPHYSTAKKMLGATRNPKRTEAEDYMEDLATKLGRSEYLKSPEVGIYFSNTPGQTDEDPYFDGEGPARKSCQFCGACLLGCRHNSKNSLDKNYLYLAEKKGVEIRANTEVTHVSPQQDGSYLVTTKNSRGLFRSKKVS